MSTMSWTSTVDGSCNMKWKHPAATSGPGLCDTSRRSPALAKMAVLSELGCTADTRTPGKST